MQLRKLHIRLTPSFDEKDAPRGIRRSPSDYNQTNNLQGRPLPRPRRSLGYKPSDKKLRTEWLIAGLQGLNT